MRRARPDELNEDAIPVLVLQLSESRLQQLFPVRLSAVEPFAEAEPSRGALVQLKGGSYLIVMFGEITHRATLSLPVSAAIDKAVTEILDEIPIQSAEVAWAAPEASAIVERMSHAAAAG